MGSNLRRKRTAKRILYTLPSIAALFISLFTLIFVFGNEIIDLTNTNYRIYINAPGHSEHSFVRTVTGLISGEGRSGMSFSIKKNLLGGLRGSDGKLVREYDSYQIIVMYARKRDVNRFARDLLETFGQSSVLIEEIVMYNALNDAFKWRRFGKFMLTQIDEHQTYEAGGIVF